MRKQGDEKAQDFSTPLTKDTSALRRLIVEFKSIGQRRTYPEGAY